MLPASLEPEFTLAATNAPRRARAVFRNDLTGERQDFADPGKLLLAHRPGEVAETLDAAEAYRLAGKWLAGYVSYEAGYALDPSLALHMPEERRVPLVCLGVFDAPSDAPAAPAPGEEPHLSGPVALWSLDDYRARFEDLHRHLALGDCYQGNLTFPVRARWRGDPFALFKRLTVRQPVRYASFIDLGGPPVLSRSPELFFDVSGDGFIETMPMKGTMPRGASTEQDEHLKELLRSDPKNLAENRMIVDLLRNDISRVSQTGTLEVPDLFRVETYPTVHQMVSRVRARLSEGVTLLEIFTALFPCGSVTGAPKISAMKILRRLESGPRDVYCGAIGWAAPDGRMRFNVAIRTITLHGNGEAVFNVGGGVVFDSTAEGEYEEALLKARFATGEVPRTL